MSSSVVSAGRSSHRSSEDCFYSPYASEEEPDIFEPCPPESKARATALASELHNIHLDGHHCNSAVKETVESRASDTIELVVAHRPPRPSISRPVDPPNQLVRWISSLRRRGTERHKLRCSSGPPRRAIHRPSSSGSSFAFITAVRSATVSLSNMSIVTRPSPASNQSRAFSSSECSGKESALGHRTSEDSLAQTVLPDLPTLERSIHRRRTLEEIVYTEEAYIGDVRFLNNVRLS
jgi:hypothetical protein